MSIYLDISGFLDRGYKGLSTYLDISGFLDRGYISLSISRNDELMTITSVIL